MITIDLPALVLHKEEFHIDAIKLVRFISDIFH